MKFTVISAASIFAVALAISSVQGAPLELSQLEERAFPQGKFQGQDFSGGKRPDPPIFGSSPRTQLNRENIYNRPDNRIHVQKDVDVKSEPAHLNPLKPGEFGPNEGESSTTIKGGKRSLFSQLEERAFPQGKFQGQDFSGGKRPDPPIFGSSPRTPLNRVNVHNTPNDRIHVQTDITQKSDPAHLNPLKPGDFGPNEGEVTTNIKGGKRSLYAATF